MDTMRGCSVALWMDDDNLGIWFCSLAAAAAGCPPQTTHSKGDNLFIINMFCFWNPLGEIIVSDTQKNTIEALLCRQAGIEEEEEAEGRCEKRS